MYSQFRFWADRIHRRNHLKLCSRCGLYYDPSNHDVCPRCSALSDDEVATLVKTRSKSRMALGRGFLIAAALLTIFMVLLGIVNA